MFFTLGGNQLQEIEFSSQDKYLAAAELGLNVRWGEAQRLRFSGAFYDYFNVTGRLNAPNTLTPSSTPFAYTAPQFMRWGNTVFNIANNINPSAQLWAYASKFRIANLNATYTLALGPYSLNVTADAVRNFGYDTAEVSANYGSYREPRTKGYQAQMSFGYPAVLTREPGARSSAIDTFSETPCDRRIHADSDFSLFRRHQCARLLCDHRPRRGKPRLAETALLERERDRRLDVQCRYAPVRREYPLLGIPA